MGLRETVFAKPPDLLKNLLGENLAVTSFKHAADQALVHMLHAAAARPGSHGAPQHVGLGAAETGRNHRDLHHLFLEDGHAQGAFQHCFQGLGGVIDRLSAAAALQERVHHVALDGARPDDGDFDHQVVETSGSQAWQHGHLRA